MTDPASPQVVSRDGQSLTTRWVEGQGIVGTCWRAFEVAGSRLTPGDETHVQPCASSRGRSIDEERGALDVVGLLHGGTTAVVLFEASDSSSVDSPWPADCFVAVGEGERARLMRRQRIALPGPPESPNATFVENDVAVPEVVVQGTARPMQPVALFVLARQRRILVAYAAWLSDRESHIATQAPSSQTAVTQDASSRITAPMMIPGVARSHEATPFRPSDHPVPPPSGGAEDWSRSVDDEATMTGDFDANDARALPWQTEGDAPKHGHAPSEPPPVGARPAAPPADWRPLHFPAPVVPAVAKLPADPVPSSPPPASPESEPAALPSRSRVVDTLWKSHDVDVLRRASRWASVERPRPRGLLPRLGREALVEPPRRDWLSDGRAITLVELSAEAGRMASGGAGESDRLERPAVVLTGVLSLDVSLGDELDALRAAVAHLAPRHKPVQRALDATKTIERGPLTPLAVLRAGIDEIVRGAEEANQDPRALRATARRSLVRARRHRELDLLGGPHVVGRWRDAGRAEDWVVYLPKEAAPSLPLEIELAARAAVTVHPRCDPDETGRWALQVHALARILTTEELHQPLS